MKIDEDRMSLQRQREPGRPGHIGRVDKTLTDKEEKGATSSCQRRKSANQICFRFNILCVIRTISRRLFFEFQWKYGFRRFSNTDRKLRSWYK
ncbi:hypothetical protein AVEN_217371-1 [Araneus ventricosus]|uniref:Uncharacterized protein n=1 Tax=Araneus ventricosus TaxID=182803 RepID=A0A4Y2HW75_ARAVE|nr:hypothetical protein AVEN_217371-1 [Araneus ventricosus]